MIHIIDDEFALPVSEPGRWRTLNYIRCLADPELLIAGKTGENYRRRDGKRWEHPGYTISREANKGNSLDLDGTVTREPATAPEDSAIYK